MFGSFTNNFFLSIGYDTEWVLWEHKAAESKNPNQWKDNMLALCSYNTVEDFWRFWNHIPRPSEVFFDGEFRKKVDGKTIEEYSLFKKGIEPEWGDPQNSTGGEWMCRQSLDGAVLDLYWQNLVLAVIGETLEEGLTLTTAATEPETDNDNNSSLPKDAINGVRVVDKSKGYPMFRLEIWLSTRDATVRETIKEKLQTMMVEGQSNIRQQQQQGGGRSNAHTPHPKFEWKDHHK